MAEYKRLKIYHISISRKFFQGGNIFLILYGFFEDSLRTEILTKGCLDQCGKTLKAVKADLDPGVV